MAKSKETHPSKRRTRKHIIASQSLNHVERFIYNKGHSAERVENDYGYDLIVSTYDADGFVESGFILLQLKATDKIRKVEKGQFVSHTISIKDYRLWMAEGYPVFLILFDAVARRAYWLDIQKHPKNHEIQEPKPKSSSITLRIPIGNEMSEATVDEMRSRKAAFMARLARVSHHD